MKPAAACGVLALVLAVSAAHAEAVYVVETLVVNIASTPGPGGERVASVKSGDKLELLERDHEQSRVRLPGGAEGWIRSSYISAEVPLQSRLAERSAEIDKLKQDVSRLHSELSAARSAASSATAAAAATISEPATEHEPPHAQSREPALETATAAADSWRWPLGTAVVALLVGFGLGWRTLDRRIRRRYGGLRIY